MCEMKFLVEDDVRQLFARLCTGLAAALLAAECASWALCPALCLPLLGLFVLLAAGVLGSAAAYFARRQKRLEEAAAQVRALLDGDATARLDSGREGQLYRLFHEVNEMAAVLNAHADREQREKQFLKNTISFKLTLCKNVFDVTGNRRFIALEQLGHLVDGQPDGIAIKGGINFGQAIFSGINDDGIFEAFIRAIHFRTSFKSCVKPEKLYRTPK